MLANKKHKTIGGIKMGLYSDTRTVDVTTAQIAEMVRAQKKVVELLADKNVSKSIVSNTYASYGGAVLGLVFVASTAASEAAGFMSLLTTLNAAEKSWLQNDVNTGYTQLLESHFTMVNGGWAKCNMTLTVNVERPNYDFAFIKSRKVNSFTTPGGQVTYPA